MWVSTQRKVPLMPIDLSDAIIVALINSAALIWVGWLQYRQNKELKAQRQTQAQDDRQKAMEQGMRALMKGELVAIHERFVQAGRPMPVEIKDEADQVYDAYHALGGNGTGTELHRQIMVANVSDDHPYHQEGPA